MLATGLLLASMIALAQPEPPRADFRLRYDPPEQAASEPVHRKVVELDLLARVPELQVLERQIGASSRTIGRIFQRETGMSYQQWRQHWRLMRAMELLATGRSLSYCSFELGFASDSAFIAFFKATTGSTPGQWLK